MNKIITSEVLIAYSQCPRKAFLLLCTNHKGTIHEYIKILAHKSQENQRQFISDLRHTSTDIQPYSIANLKNSADILTTVTLQAEGLEATYGLLTKVSGQLSLRANDFRRHTKNQRGAETHPVFCWSCFRVGTEQVTPEGENCRCR